MKKLAIGKRLEAAKKAVRRARWNWINASDDADVEPYRRGKMIACHHARKRWVRASSHLRQIYRMISEASP